MILIDSCELMVAGDEFEMRYGDWDRILRPFVYSSPSPVDKSGRKVRCKVLRVFARSPREVRYICVSLDDPRGEEFVLGQILEPVY